MKNQGFDVRRLLKRVGLCAMLLSFVTACAGEKPKPMAQPTPDQVRGHADKTFDKLKQEEQDRASQSMPR